MAKKKGIEDDGPFRDSTGQEITTERCLYTLALHVSRIADVLERHERRMLAESTMTEKIMKHAMASAGIDSKDDDNGEPS